MKITSRFTVAVHTLLVIYFFGDKTRTTSEFIAESVNVNPVVIRRTLLSLKSAGMIEVKAGCGGARIVRDLKDITLYDGYTGVDSGEGDLLPLHEEPKPAYTEGKKHHAGLAGNIFAAQRARGNELRKVSLADLARDLDVKTFACK